MVVTSHVTCNISAVWHCAKICSGHWLAVGSIPVTSVTFPKVVKYFVYFRKKICQKTLKIAQSNCTAIACDRNFTFYLVQFELDPTQWRRINLCLRDKFRPKSTNFNSLHRASTSKTIFNCYPYLKKPRFDLLKNGFG